MAYGDTSKTGPVRYIKPYTRPEAPPKAAYPGFRPGTVIEQGMRIDREIKVPMRDGGFIYADLYRPEKATEALAAVISWGPYGKHGGPARIKTFFPAAGVDPAWGVSDYAPTEAPDPVTWCARGFAVIFPDPRGTWQTPGKFTMATLQEAEDFHDLIEWAGMQDWCSGRVGLTGASYLAFSQWRVAATRPPHLAAINPWEGLNDFYREIAYHGGIPESRFLDLLAKKAMGYADPEIAEIEDVVALAAAHPLYDEYWESKAADVSRVEVPAYVVAGMANHGLHLRGTLEAYKQLPEKNKWLEIHGRKIWSYYYQPESVENQIRFFEWALKGARNGWSERPKVLVEVRDRCNVGEMRAESSWPLARTTYKKLFLDAATASMSLTAPVKAAVTSYDTKKVPDGETPGRAVFEHEFAADTDLIGYMKLRLWIEVDEGNDADLFVAAQKVDASGATVGFPFVAFREDGPVALGWLRASHRELDPARSTPQQPWHPHTREEPLEPGVPVPVEIELWASSTRFAAGERLRIVVQGTDVYGPKGEFGHDVTRNRGRHLLHSGAHYDSHLLAPFVASK